MQILKIMPTEEVYKAMKRFKKDKDGTVIIKYLMDKATNEAVRSCTLKDEVDSRWAQGRAQGINQFLAEIEHCEQQLEVLEEISKRKTD